MDNIEKEWKNGDESEELEEEFERQQKINNKMKNPINFDNPDEVIISLLIYYLFFTN